MAFGSFFSTWESSRSYVNGNHILGRKRVPQVTTHKAKMIVVSVVPSIGQVICRNEDVNMIMVPSAMSPPCSTSLAFIPNVSQTEP